MNEASTHPAVAANESFTPNEPASIPAGTTFEQIFPNDILTPPPAAAAKLGRVELLSTECAIGWASVNEDGTYAHVVASLDGRILGTGRADIVREDLETARAVHALHGRAFAISYEAPVSGTDAAKVIVKVVESGAALRIESTLKIESAPPVRIFILGSPRSGTSQLGATLVSTLGLAWTGEAHVAPRFATAAECLGGDSKSPNEFVRALADWNLRKTAIDAARRAYFYIHSSSSFLDKTPGVDMVRAAPFMAECFRDAKFIFIRRHPIANIMSRLAKFGGDFEEHCNDWVATMKEWLRVRGQLANCLELQQEDMAFMPEIAAKALTCFLGRPELLGSIRTSLSSYFLERTGAGLGCVSLAQTNWSEEQKVKFTSICDVITRAFGYTVQE